MCRTSRDVNLERSKQLGIPKLHQFGLIGWLKCFKSLTCMSSGHTGLITCQSHVIRCLIIYRPYSLVEPAYEKASESCADPESFVRGCPSLTTFFFLLFFSDERRENLNTTISEPTSARQRNAPTLNAGLVAL